MQVFYTTKKPPILTAVFNDYSLVLFHIIRNYIAIFFAFPILIYSLSSSLAAMRAEPQPQNGSKTVYPNEIGVLGWM